MIASSTEPAIQVFALDGESNTRPFSMLADALTTENSARVREIWLSHERKDVSRAGGEFFFWGGSSKSHNDCLIFSVWIHSRGESFITLLAENTNNVKQVFTVHILSFRD